MKEIAVGSQVALVDDEDYPKVSEYAWRLLRTGKQVYAYSKTVGYMHRLIVDFAMVDHKNGNGLDNRKSNLRETTRSVNAQNTGKSDGQYTSQYKGVYYLNENYGRRKKWVARIRAHGRNVHLGYHMTEVDAARAYNNAALELYGPDAYVNPIREETLS